MSAPTQQASTTDASAWRSRIVGAADASPADLNANPANWRLHPIAQEQAMGAVLDQVGWVQQVIVNRTTGRLVDGHLRLSLALARGEASIPVVYVELTEEEEALVLASFDPITGMAIADEEKIQALLATGFPRPASVTGTNAILPSAADEIFSSE